MDSHAGTRWRKILRGKRTGNGRSYCYRCNSRWSIDNMLICQDCGDEYCPDCAGFQVSREHCPCGGLLRMMTHADWLYVVK